MPPSPVPAAPPAQGVLEALTTGPLSASTVLGALLPLLVGLVTKRSWPAAAKGVMLAVASLFTAIGIEFAGRSSLDELAPVDWPAILAAGFTTWVAGQVAHTSVWRHTAVSAQLQDIGSRTPSPASDAAGSNARDDAVRRADWSASAVIARVHADKTAPRATSRDRTPAGRHALLDADEPRTLPDH